MTTAWIVHGAQRALGLELAPPHRWVRHGEWTSYWLGLQQWLLTHAQRRDDYETQRDALLAAGGALFDVSDARVVMPVDAATLAKGCSLDLDTRGFPPGECRSTLFARIAVLVAREDESAFTMFVPRSYAESLRGWLDEAALPQQTTS